MTASTPYRIEVPAEARRGLRRLTAKVASAIIEFITGALADNPARLTKPLTNELHALRSARRGDYRVLIRIDESEHLVLVVRIDHRADVYRSRYSLAASAVDLTRGREIRDERGYRGAGERGSVQVCGS